MNRQLNIDAALDSRIAALYCRLSRDDELQGDSNTQFFVDVAVIIGLKTLRLKKC